MQHNCDIIDSFPNYRVYSSKHLTKSQTLIRLIERWNDNCFELIFYLPYHLKIVENQGCER